MRSCIIQSAKGRHKQGPARYYRRIPSPRVNLGQPDPEALMFRGLRGRVKWVVWTRASIRIQGPLTHAHSGNPVSACLNTLPCCSGLGSIAGNSPWFLLVAVTQPTLQLLPPVTHRVEEERKWRQREDDEREAELHLRLRRAGLEAAGGQGTSARQWGREFVGVCRTSALSVEGKPGTPVASEFFSLCVRSI